MAKNHEKAAEVDVEGGEVDERTRTTNAESRPTRDPGDTTGDGKRRPDEPTEPPDQLKGASARGGEERVEARIQRGHTGRTARSDHDADARSDTGDVEGRREVQGGGKEVGRGSGDSAANDASGESRRLVLKALAEDESCQRPERLTNESNDSPEPPKPPDKPALRRTESSSVEPEGESVAATSCDVERTRGDTDAPRAPEDVENAVKRPENLPDALGREQECSKRRTRQNSPRRARGELEDPRAQADASRASEDVHGDGNAPKKPRSASELERKRSKRKDEDNSPSRPREEPEDQSGETDVPGGSHTYQEGPRYQGNERVVETNASNPDGGPGGDMGTQETSEVVEGDPDREKVVDQAGDDGICPSSDGNERRVETSSPCRDRRPEGHMVEPKASKGVEGDWRRRIDGEGVGYDRRRGGKDGATSSASHDSKQVGTRLLAGDKSGRNGKRKRANTDVPGPSRPPPSHPRRPAESVDPPRRRGRLKSPTRKIRRSKRRRLTY